MIKAYYGYFNDSKKTLASSSGGAATALAEAFINNNGIVVGVSYTADFKQAAFKVINSIDDLAFLKGSKYVETAKFVINKNKCLLHDVIISLLKDNKKVLVFCMGCDANAILLACACNKTDIDNLYIVDLLCHGPTYQIVHKKFIKSIEKKYHSKVANFTVRYKKDGWVPPYINAEFKNGCKYIEPFYETDYGYAFQNYIKKGCYNCPFRGNKHNSCITLGDYWGINQGMKEYNKNGVSIIFVHNNKGKELLQLIDKKDFYIRETDSNFALSNNTNFYQSQIQNTIWETFNKCINKYNLHKTVLICKYGLKKAKIQLLKENKIVHRIYCTMPKFIKKFIKKTIL